MQTQTIKRFLLLGVVPKKHMTDEIVLKEMEEVWSLVMALGQGEIVDAIVQRADHPDNATYIGPGKIVEVAEKVNEKQIDVVVLNNIAKAGQVHNLQKKLYEANHNIEVWDRVDLILAIFSRHAHTSEAKLQIELAKMRHMGPRIYGMGQVLSNQASGIGAVGIGETNTELMKRHWARAMDKVTKDLEKLSQERERQLEHRKRMGLSTISIVGYTNAGKTTLFNRLTGKGKLEANQLFATLDSSVGKLYLPTLQKEVLVSDTIGFIKNLPPKLIQAFRSTLSESIHADILIHVIDISDPEINQKITTVEEILKSLSVENAYKIYVFNKIDAGGRDREFYQGKYSEFSPVFLSAKTDEGIDALVTLLEEKMKILE
ncbi:MAG TPA: GTPase HflX [Candidatus Saccharimonadales bacterium]|nr:GTPase HflX [Candidatus Saccharimonadales bacterium]